MAEGVTLDPPRHPPRDPPRDPSRHPEAARPTPPSKLAVGTIVWLASEVMFFGGLFAAYFTLRANERSWPPADVHLETTAAALATGVLVLSSITIHRAGTARLRGDRLAMQRWMIITLALGALFLANQLREMFSLGFSISSSGYGSMYYVMTGFHGLHVLAGLVLIVVALALSGGGASLERRTPMLESVTYYWHFVDVVWIGLFATLFLLR